MFKTHFGAGVLGAVLIIIFLIIGAIMCGIHNYVPIYIINPDNVQTDCLERIKAINELKNNGLILTPSEYTNNIASFYNTIITFIIALFALFSFITYRISRQSVREQVSEEVKNALTEMMRDSKEFENNIMESIYGRFSEEYATLESFQALANKVENLSEKVVASGANAEKNETII